MHSVARHAFFLFKNTKTIEVSKCPPGLISFKLMVLSVKKR